MLILHIGIFDGITCTINIWNAISDISKKSFQYFICGYTKIDKQIDKIERIDFDVLFITDLNLTKEQLERISKFKTVKNKIVYLDHHVYDYDIESFCESLNIICVHDESLCGASITYNFLEDKKSSSSSFLHHLLEINRITNIYDMWYKEDEIFISKCLPLNDLFFEFGAFEFFKRFNSGQIEYTEDEIKVIEKKKRDRMYYLEDSIKNHSIIDLDTKTIYIANPKSGFTNDFTIFYPEYNVYVILREYGDNKYQYSIRVSKNLDLTVQHIFDQVNKINDCMLLFGGHAKSGGITITEENNILFLETMNLALNQLIGVL